MNQWCVLPITTPFSNIHQKKTCPHFKFSWIITKLRCPRLWKPKQSRFLRKKHYSTTSWRMRWIHNTEATWNSTLILTLQQPNLAQMVVTLSSLFLKFHLLKNLPQQVFISKNVNKYRNMTTSAILRSS